MSSRGTCPARQGSAVTYEGLIALITGASSGIGAAFAKALAARGADLILVARREQTLETLADDLRGAHGVRIFVCPADLALPGATAAVAACISELGLQVDVLINSAGFATHGTVVAVAPELLSAQVSVNAAAVVNLTRHYLPAMLERDRGVVCNIASTVAFQPVPMLATYAATKAFVLAFTEAVWQETRSSGVRVVAVCPGVTDTPFFDRVGVDVPAASVRRRTPEQVVASALRAVDKRSASVVDGRLNRLGTLVPRVLPRQLVLKIAAQVVRPRREGRYFARRALR